MEVLTGLGSELLSYAFSVKQYERIEVSVGFVVFEGGIDAFSAAFLLGILQGLVVGICLFAAALCNMLKIVLWEYVSQDHAPCSIEFGWSDVDRLETSKSNAGSYLSCGKSWVVAGLSAFCSTVLFIVCNDVF